MHTSALFQSRLRAVTSLRPLRGSSGRRVLLVAARAGGGGGQETAYRRAPNPSRGRGNKQQAADEDEAVDDEEEESFEAPVRYRRPSAEDEAPAAAAAAPVAPAYTPRAAEPAPGSSSSSGRSTYSGGSSYSRDAGSAGRDGSAPAATTSYRSDRAGQYTMGGASTGGAATGMPQYGGGAGPAYGARRNADTPDSRARFALTARINRAAGWRDLAAIMADSGHQMDNDHVTSILELVAQANRPTDEAGMAEFEAMLSVLYGWTVALLPRFKPSNAATCIWAVSELVYFNTELVTGLCTVLLTGMGNLQVGTSAISNEYYNTIDALANMNFSPGHDWLAEFDSRTQKKLSLFPMNQMCGTFLALTKLGHQPTPEWMAALALGTKTQIRYMNPAQLVQVLTAAANHRASGGTLDNSWLDDMLGNGTQIAGMYARTLRETVAAIIQLDYQPRVPVLKALVEGFLIQLPRMSGGEVANLAYSLAYLKVPVDLANLVLELPPDASAYKPRPPASLVDELQRITMRNLPSLTGDELAYMTAALAAFGLRPKDRWIDDLILAIDKRLPECSGSALAMLADALPLMYRGHRLNLCVDRARLMLAAMQANAQPGQVYEEQPESSV